jgi:hypothetical protein
MTYLHRGREHVKNDRPVRCTEADTENLRLISRLCVQPQSRSEKFQARTFARFARSAATGNTLLETRRSEETWARAVARIFRKIWHKSP